jgi:hypothetical protein
VHDLIFSLVTFFCIKAKESNPPEAAAERGLLQKLRVKRGSPADCLLFVGAGLAPARLAPIIVCTQGDRKGRPYDMNG